MNCPECNVRMERTEKFRCPGCGAEFDRSDDWISVKLRLPEKHGYYLWWDEREQKPYIEYYMIGELPYPGLSHWQYQPEPPKEDE